MFRYLLMGLGRHRYKAICIYSILNHFAKLTVRLQFSATSAL